MAVGLVDVLTGLLKGAVTFHDYNGSNVELSYWGPNSITRGAIKGLALFCFNSLKVNRVTVRTPRRNKAVTRGLPKLGFRAEGLLRRYYGPHRNDDAVIFGITVEDARRLMGARLH